MPPLENAQKNAAVLAQWLDAEAGDLRYDGTDVAELVAYLCSDAAGSVTVGGLTAYLPVPVGVDESSLEDPMLVPKKALQVVVPRPDIDGREQILAVHMKKVPLAPDVEPRVIARGTPGFSGADLANLVNEAALLAARRGKRLVAMKEFEEAKDKVMMGTERKSMVMTEDEKKMTAYHEAGHALVFAHEPTADPRYDESPHAARIAAHLGSLAGKTPAEVIRENILAANAALKTRIGIEPAKNGYDVHALISYDGE